MGSVVEGQTSATTGESVDRAGDEKESPMGSRALGVVRDPFQRLLAVGQAPNRNTVASECNR